MKQLVRDPKAPSGVRVADVPEPALLPGTVLVATRFSAISPGTERNMTAAGWSGALRSVRERPDLVRRVVGMARRDGVRSTWERVRARMSDATPLGSSSSGTVIATSPELETSLREGDRVACTGSGLAIHGDVACMPAMLCIPVPEGVALDHAAFGTLGAIALHAVRVARPELGERFAVIGLGLIGQLVAQVLRAHGARVAGFDLVASRAELALACGAEIAHAGDTDDQVARALAWSEGGVDGVIVAAQSSDDAPMIAAARMSRDRGRIVATGLVPFGLPREIAYEKELELRISRSTGAGRHDPSYEIGGADYPVEHVRWTLARNVEAFLHLLREGRVKLEPLVTRRIGIDDAPRIFEGGPSLGAVVEYSGARTERSQELRAEGDGDVGIALIGAGLFAKGTLLPELKRANGVRLRRVVAATGLSASEAAKEHGAEIAGTDVDEALGDPAVKAVVIATRHDSHASLAARALRAGKHVLVEKPLALTRAEVDDVEAAARESGRVLLVGTNRRFAPLSVVARRELAGRGPLAIAIRVASPELPDDHWLLDRDAGGGRLAGEGCHFLDLASFLAGDSGLAEVSTIDSGAAGFAIQARFEDGSTAQILCTTAASPRLAKERIEAHAGGLTVTIEDYSSGTVLSPGGESRRLAEKGKGHAQEIAAFLDGVRSGRLPVKLETMLAVAGALAR